VKLAGAAVFALALALYAALLPLGVAQWDPGEMQTVPYILGIPHAPGFPLYVLIGWIWTHVVPFGDVATRMTALSAICGAFAAYVLYRAACELGASRAAAVLGATLFTLAPVVVVHVTRTGVEPMLALLVAVTVWAALRHARSGSRRALLVASGAAGLACAVHTLAIWFLPGIAVLLVRPGTKPRDLLLACGALLAGLLPYSYLPLRSAVVARLGLDPTVALGLAPGVQGLLDNDHPAAWAGFVRHVTGARFGASDALGAPFVLAAYPAYLDRWWEILAGPGVVAGGLSLVGLGALAARRPRIGAGLALIAFLAIPFSLRYGALQDAAKYYLVATWVGALAVSVGVGVILDGLRPGALRRTAAYVLVAATIFGLAHVLAADPGTYAQRHIVDGRQVIDGVLAATPEDAIIIAAWTFATPLAYAQYVEHRFGGRQVITDEAPPKLVARWRATRPVYVIPYDAERKPRDLHLVPVPASWPTIYRVAP
jgi:Protein of unknown function (DUF2723)